MELKSFVIGYEHPICDKRTLRSVLALSKLGEVHYQYLDVKSVNINCIEKLPANVILLPMKKAEHSTNVIHWYRKWRKFDKKLLEQLNKIKPNLVYFHAMPLTLTYLFKKAKTLNATVVFDIHEVIPDQFGRDSWRVDLVRGLLWKVFGKILDISDKLIFVSKEAADYMLKKTGIVKDYYLLPNYAMNAIEPKSPKHREKSVIVVGGSKRIVKYEILKVFNSAGYKLKFIGGMVPEKIDENWQIEFLPFLPYEEMLKEVSKGMFTLLSMRSTVKKSWYSNDVYSLPSKFLDSIAAGTPVIVEGYFESVSSWVKRDGIGFVFNTPYELENFLSGLQIEEYSKLIENIRNSQERYVWNEQKEREYIQFIKEF